MKNQDAFSTILRGAENASWLLRRVLHERGSDSRGVPFSLYDREHMLRNHERLLKKVRDFCDTGIQL